MRQTAGRPDRTDAEAEAKAETEAEAEAGAKGGKKDNRKRQHRCQAKGHYANSIKTNTLCR